MRFSSRLFLYASALTALAACAACSRVETPAVPGDVRVVFALPAPTKASLESVESSVRSVDLLVFDHATGARIGADRVEGDHIVMTLPAGRELDYRAVANVPSGEVSDCMSADVLDARVARFADAASDRFRMVAGGRRTFHDASEVTLEAERMACKVEIRSVTYSLLDGQGGSSVRLERIYLINVCGSEPYSLVPADGGTWYNRLTPDGTLSGVQRECLIADVGRSLAVGEPDTHGYSFYCFPNPVNNGLNSIVDPDWSPRNTRLVVELSIDGVTNYFPITIDRAMQSNCHYLIESAVLRGWGSDHPDKPVIRGTVSCSVEVAEWTDDDPQELTVGN